MPPGHERLINSWEKGPPMRLSNQAMVALITIACLLAQGYLFTYILNVEPNVIIDFIPLIPYILYIYARNKEAWYYDKLLYWMAATIALTMIDVVPFLYQAYR